MARQPPITGGVKVGPCRLDFSEPIDIRRPSWALVAGKTTPRPLRGITDGHQKTGRVDLAAKTCLLIVVAGVPPVENKRPFDLYTIPLIRHDPSGHGSLLPF